MKNSKSYLLLILLCIVSICKGQFNADSLDRILKEHPNTKYLHISSAELSQRDLNKITQFEFLEVFEISESSGIKSLPADLFKLKKLKSLAFFWNGGVENAINWEVEAEKISKVKSLTTLNLGPYNDFDTLPVQLTRLTNLVNLDLNMTDLMMLPDEIINLENLETIKLSMTYMESLPVVMLQMKKLKKIILIDTPISKNKELVEHYQKLYGEKNIELVF